MSTVETAASLFGSDGDSGLDPFAVIGNEETDTTPPAGLSGHEFELHHSASSSYPSDMGQDASSLFTEDHMPQSAQHFQEDPWSVPADQDSSGPDNEQYSSNSAAGYEQSQGQYSAPSYPATQPQATYAQQPGVSVVPFCSICSINLKQRKGTILLERVSINSTDQTRTPLPHNPAGAMSLTSPLLTPQPPVHHNRLPRLQILRKHMTRITL